MGFVSEHVVKVLELFDDGAVGSAGFSSLLTMRVQLGVESLDGVLCLGFFRRAEVFHGQRTKCGTGFG